MHIIIPVVLSADGKMSKGDEGRAHHWSSAEDTAFFDQLKAEFSLIVMGRKTYEVMRPPLDAEHLRVVLTSQPEKLAAKTVPGRLEFMNGSPAELIEQLTKRGFEKMLLVGGRLVHSAFLAAKLVDEIFITIEPRLFGNGLSLLEDDELVDIPLQLLSMRQLNPRGTLLLHYRVEKLSEK